MTSAGVTPNSSAAIWAKVVSVPWPWGDNPVWIVTRLLGNLYYRHVGGEGIRAPSQGIAAHEIQNWFLTWRQQFLVISSSRHPIEGHVSPGAVAIVGTAIL